MGLEDDLRDDLPGGFRSIPFRSLLLAGRIWQVSGGRCWDPAGVVAELRCV